MEDLDYEEQSDQLITNLSKLATSTDFASERQIMELEQQLEDLEKERQETLRTRAQEAVIEAIDSEVEEINNKFDKLLNNSELLLEAMQGSMQDSSFLTQILASARESGMTALELESFAEEVKDAFSSENIGTDNIKEVLEQVINNATINVGNRTFDLDTEDGNEM
jgi:arginyl-tRNA synthetase